MSSCHVVRPTSSLFLFSFFLCVCGPFCVSHPLDAPSMMSVPFDFIVWISSFALVHLRLLRPFGHSAHLPPSLLLAFTGKRMQKHI